MLLEGSCHCQAVTFSCQAFGPVPYMKCYCSICRKTGGGGGYAINLGALSDSLVVTGEAAIAVYHAKIDDVESPAERRFCSRCGAQLWVWDPRWPDLVHPFASAIDTPLPSPPENVHIMLDAKPDWVDMSGADPANCFPSYPSESLKAWHERHGLLDEFRE